jgi:hypothetical protein
LDRTEAQRQEVMAKGACPGRSTHRRGPRSRRARARR